MARPMSDYERRRQSNIADNKRILAALGLLDPLNDKPTLELILNLKKRKPDHDSEDQPPKKRVKKAKVVLSEVNQGSTELGSICGFVRRSARNSLEGKATKTELLSLRTDEEECENDKPRLKAPPNREKFYGAVSSVVIGTSYDTRMEFSVVGVHRPTVAGIHGGPDGAYSIALSGGYEDDIDGGEFFTYTGEGGRDLKGTRNKPKNLRTAPQSKNQTLTKGNLALSRNVETGNPVRVIRGYKSRSPYAPEEGYRYDGLYSVEKAWFTTGLSGFGVWKFAMKRCADQPPPPWNYVGGDSTVDPAIPDDTKIEKTEDLPLVKEHASSSSSDSESDDEEQMSSEKVEETSQKKKTQKQGSPKQPSTTTETDATTTIENDPKVVNRLAELASAAIPHRDSTE